MDRLPEFRNIEIVQRNVGHGHRYFVAAYPCERCFACKRGKKCIGLPSVTSFSGQYGGGGLYPAGYRHALDAVFGAYTNSDKDELQENSWMSDLIRSGITSEDLLVYRQEVEEIPTPGEVARDFGTGVHKSLENILRGDDEAEIPARYANAVSAVLTWLEKGGSDGPYIVEDTEVNVFHPQLLIGGQIDCVARAGNRPVIIDWKSGRNIYENHAMQIAAYAMCYEAMTGEVVTEAWIVKSGLHGFEAKRVEDLRPAQNAFIAMQEVKRNVDLINFI